MRDAFGGAFMIKLFLIFIIIYVGFTAIALNYAKAFKVKNKVIEYLETNEIDDLYEMTASEAVKISEFFDKEILGNMNYVVDNPSCQTEGVKKDPVTRKGIYYCHPSGVTITQIDVNENNNDVGVGEEKIKTNTNVDGVYYKVETQVGWSIPFINKILAINGSENGAEVSTGRWKISGETRLIVKE